jgi:hypothetical protein
MLADNLRDFTCPHVPLNPGTAVGQPEACPDCLAGRLMELFPDIHARQEWHSADDSWICPAEIVPAGATHVRFELCTTPTPITEETL